MTQLLTLNSRVSAAFSLISMPLRIADTTVSPAQASESFLVFYSSVVDGKLWCPDCQDVEEIVKKTFEPEDAPSAVIVYVGDRNTWKSPSNSFRKAPWSLSSIPTIVKMRDGKEEARLVEGEILNQLEGFVKK
ncbi:hypothetical protein VKT23_005445 [Stygiomarasmius scandens]|uniref:Thioredoxin domain-containing protein n=1 Tax=Marasmiellus scandens TaxID=2682957 RepID=A0ABR1JST6_9AGAR